VSYRIEDFSDVTGEIQRIVVEQIDGAIKEIDDPELDAPTAVHEVRKHCKKTRAVLRLSRGALEKDETYRSENARFRDIARELSVLRDADVLIATHDAVTADIHNPDILIECAAVRGRLTTGRRRIAEEETGLEERLKAARTGLLEARGRIPDWAWRVRNFQGLRPGLEKTYRRGRRAMAEAYKTGAAEAFHEFRKRVKYHWYACRLLRDIWPSSMDARRNELSLLSDLLGDEHDLSVYHATLESNPDWFGRNNHMKDILAVADARRDALRREAYSVAMRLYAEKPGQLSGRFWKYWQSRQAEVA